MIFHWRYQPGALHLLKECCHNSSRYNYLSNESYRSCLTNCSGNCYSMNLRGLMSSVMMNYLMNVKKNYWNSMSLNLSLNGWKMMSWNCLNCKSLKKMNSGLMMTKKSVSSKKNCSVSSTMSCFVNLKMMNCGKSLMTKAASSNLMKRNSKMNCSGCLRMNCLKSGNCLKKMTTSCLKKMNCGLMNCCLTNLTTASLTRKNSAMTRKTSFASLKMNCLNLMKTCLILRSLKKMTAGKVLTKKMNFG